MHSTDTNRGNVWTKFRKKTTKTESKSKKFLGQIRIATRQTSSAVPTEQFIPKSITNRCPTHGWTLWLLKYVAIYLTFALQNYITSDLFTMLYKVILLRTFAAVHNTDTVSTFLILLWMVLFLPITTWRTHVKDHDLFLLPNVLKFTSVLIEKEPLQPRNSNHLLKAEVPR